MKKLIITLCILSTQLFYAQVGIGTVTPDASSELDITSTTRGVLISRMTALQRMLISSPATSLMVYQTDNVTGYYYYDGSSWVLLSDSSTTVTKIDGLNDGKSDSDGSQDGSSIFIGIDSGVNDDSSDNQNTGVGYQSLNANTTGRNNTANGYQALFSNTTGNFNTANGHQSLYSNIAGVRNSVNGYQGLFSNNSGRHNTANGYQALFSNTTGFYNTANGVWSIYFNTTGNYNTAIGYSAYFNSNNLDNTTCIGNNSGKVNSVSNRIEIGNTSISWIGGQVGWSTYSDKRIKKDIQENVPGLDFIKRLRPVTYHLDIHKQNKLIKRGKKGNEETEWNSKYDIENKQMTGFIAQEVAQASQDVGYDFSGVEKAKDNLGMYSIRYSEFVMPLVKAVQELEAENTLKDIEIQNLRERLKRIEQIISNGLKPLQN